MNAITQRPDDPYHMLREVAVEALENGDRHPADVLLSSLRNEVERLESPTFTTGRAWEKDWSQAFGGGRADRLIDPKPDKLEQAKLVKSRVREVAKLIAAAPKSLEALPNPEHGQAQAFTTIQYRRAVRRGRHRHPLNYMDLTGHQKWACDEIARIQESISRLIEGGGSMTGIVRVDGHGPKRDPLLDAMGDESWQAYINNYRPWSKRNRRVRIKTLNATNLVLMVVRDGVSTRVIAEHIGARDRKVRQAFRDCLNDYGR